MNNQKGLAPLVILIIIAILGVAGISVYRNQNTNQNRDKTVISTESPSPGISPTPTPTAKPNVTNKIATPTPSPKISVSPTPSPTSTISSQISCEVISSPNDGYAPLTVNLSQNIKSPNGPSGLQWDYDGDGKWDTEMVLGNYSPQYTYQKSGTYTVKLSVRTSQGDTSCSKSITVKPASIECKVHADKTGNTKEFDFAYEASMLGRIDNVDNNKDLVEAAQWDFDGNGSWDTSFDAASKKLKYTYSSSGNYNVRLQVRAQGNVTSEVCTKTVSVQ